MARGCCCNLSLPSPNQRLRASRPAGAATRTAKERSADRSVDRDEEPEAEQRGQLGRLRRGGEERAQQRRGVQAGEEGRGEEPEAAHEGPLPQALLPHPSRRRRHARLPPLRRRVGGGVLQSRQQAGKKATATSRPRFLAPPPPTSHGGSEPVRSPRTIHSLLYRAQAQRTGRFRITASMAFLATSFRNRY